MTREHLEGEGRADSSSWVIAVNFFALCPLLCPLFIPLEILRTVPHSPTLSKFLVMEFSLEFSISRYDRCGLQFGSSLSANPLLSLFSLTPESCVLWCFSLTSNFNFLASPRPAMAPCYFNLGSLSHSCFFLAWPWHSHSWCIQLLPSKPSEFQSSPGHKTGLIFYGFLSLTVEDFRYQKSNSHVM